MCADTQELMLLTLCTLFEYAIKLNVFLDVHNFGKAYHMLI